MNWDLGKYGKGLVHNGNVHTWGTDVYDGQPTHPQYAEQALDMTASDYLHNPIFDSAFQIYPHGEVGMYESQGDLPRIIEQADPRLKIHDQKGMGFPEKRWDFQTRATTWRFAVAAPWQLGTSGKGLYFPETGVLQTWDDNNGQTHLDVLQEDENAKSGNAHHLAILPNGTIRDQGCLDKDFADVDGDTEGLQRALRELDPRLKLEPPSDWAFNVGPTEVMETEPSAISRGEEGGSTHGVQTGGDFAGSL